MTETLDDLYLAWLYSQVGDVKERNKSRTYWGLLSQLYSKEFIWLIPNDDNRAQDGLDLRIEWLDEIPNHQWDISPTPEWLRRNCTLLEVVVALSRRLAFEGEGHPPAWFWHLMENLGLLSCTDRPGYDREEVDERLDAVVLRTYEPNGRGGLFPLKHTENDQREVELWYQMNEYLTHS